MPTWIKQGTISIANGSATVNGVGTNWGGGRVKPGDRLIHPSVVFGEIESVSSDTQLTLSTAYAGSAINGDEYAIQPTIGVVEAFYQAVTQFLVAQQGYVDGPLAGRFPAGSAGEPSLAFAGDINTGLYSPAADQIGMVTGGVQRALLSSAAFNLSVPIKGSAVQSGPTDLTAGRVMTVGAFGLGAGTPPEITDFTAGLSPGLYRVTNLSTVTGGPAGAPALQGTAIVNRGTGGRAGVLLHVSASLSASQQLWFGARMTTTGAIWWTEVLHKNNLLGTVSQSGGVPTGAVIERGSNANGEYIRFADGTQICWHTLTVSLAINLAYFGGFRSGGQNATFPAAFSAAPATTITAINSTALGGVAQGLPSTNSWSWAVTAVTTQAAANRTVDLIATGRWF